MRLEFLTMLSTTIHQRMMCNVNYVLTYVSCDRFVDVLGIKTLFAVYMGKGQAKASKKRRREETEQEGSHILTSSIHVADLIRTYFIDYGFANEITFRSACTTFAQQVYGE